MDESKKAELFKVLGVESRIRIIDLLKEKGPLGVTELAETMGITPSAVSQHLKVLRFAGLVRGQRKGYHLPYKIDPFAMEQCGEILSQVCNCGCSGSGRVCLPDKGNTGETLESLLEHKQKLLKKLEGVQARIRELGGED